MGWAITQFMETSIFKHSSTRDFLSHLYEEKKERNPHFSLRAWSKQLGFSSPNMLSMILRGERNVTPRLASVIAKSLDFAFNEQKYFEILCLFEKSKSEEEKKIYSDLLTKFSPVQNVHVINNGKFKVISEWYHFVIYEMVALKDFVYDYQWIAKKLRFNVTLYKIKEAIERMISLGMLAEQEGSLVQCSTEVLSTTDDIPSNPLRDHHRDMIEFSKSAIDDEINNRQISSLTMAINKEDIRKIKALIKDFELKLDEIVSKSTDADHVYQLNTQFFNILKESSNEVH